jgi:hypothetical protein
MRIEAVLHPHQLAISRVDELFLQRVVDEAGQA